MLEIITDLESMSDAQYDAFQEMYDALNADEDQICQQLNNGYYTGAGTFDAWYQNRVNNGDNIIMVFNKVQDEYVGFTSYCYYPDDREVSLSQVFVKAGYRRCGYAKELLDCVMARVKSLDAVSIYLTVLSLNSAAKALYAQYGFTPAIEMHQRTL